MKAMVTGGAGFAGSALRLHLAIEGDDVVPFGAEKPNSVDVLDRSGVREAIAGSGAEVLYHLAAVSLGGGNFDNSLQTIRINVEGTLNVLDACREAGVRRVLVIGSAEQYGTGAGMAHPFTEESPMRPISPYGASKVAAEYLGLQAYLGNGLETVMTRSFNHTGRGQSPKFVIPAFALRIAQAERDGKDEIETGRLDAVREFNDVRDVVRAYRLLMLTGTPGSIYNVCSGMSCVVSEVVDRLLKMADRPLRLKLIASLVRSGEPGSWVGDPSKLVAATGWRPNHSLEETLADVLGEARRQVR